MSDLLITLAVLLALLIGAVLAFAARRRAIAHRGGVFDCSLRERPVPAGRGWMLGLARYAEDTVEWHRVFSFSPRPRCQISRRGLVVLQRREPSTAEAYALLPGAVVVECRVQGREFELGMKEDALTGFLAWIESSPPGRDVNVA